MRRGMGLAGVWWLWDLFFRVGKGERNAGTGMCGNQLFARAFFPRFFGGVLDRSLDRTPAMEGASLALLSDDRERWTLYNTDADSK